MEKISSLANKTYQKISQLIHPIAGFPLYAAILFLAMFSAYKLMLSNLGFYYDDWEGVLLQKQQFSFSQIWNYFLIDRPFSSVIHTILNPIIGTKPAGWHLFGLLVNWAAVLFFVKVLLRIWPKRVLEIGWIGLLLGVYPGITRQFVIRTSMVHYVSFFLFSLSLFLMVKAIQEKDHRWLNLTFALLFAIMQMLIIEYFAGLELIRLFVIFYIIRREELKIGPVLKKTLINWLPYLLIFILFVVFRLSLLPLIQQDGMAAKNTPWFLTALQQNPLELIFQQIEIILQDLVYAVMYVWSQTILPEDIDLHAKTTILSWVVGLFVAAISLLFMSIWHKKTNVGENESEANPVFIVFLCLMALILGGLPIWAVGRQAIKGLWASRYLFGIVLGAVPLFVLAISWAFGKKRSTVFSVVMALFLVASVAFQIRTAKTYTLTWHYAQDYFWQLKWRAPALEENTFILSPYTPYQFSSDYQIAYTTNVMYATGYDSEEMKYWWFDGPDDIINHTTKQYPEEREIDLEFRNLHFESNMDMALPVIYRPARGCLMVLDTAYMGAPLLGEENQLFSTYNEGLVIDEEQPVPTDIFGKEPEPNWCYYFQRADLARSQQNWQEISSYWDEIENQGFRPMYGPEYLPFIEAYAHQNNWEQVYYLIQQANLTTPKMEPFLCSTWNRISDDTGESTEKDQNGIMVENLLKCETLP